MPEGEVPHEKKCSCPEAIIVGIDPKINKWYLQLLVEKVKKA